jgi:hypothetical protein
MCFLHLVSMNSYPNSDPIIFRGLKSITMNDTQQQSLLRLAAEGISVSLHFLVLDYSLIN